MLKIDKRLVALEKTAQSNVEQIDDLEQAPAQNLIDNKNSFMSVLWLSSQAYSAPGWRQCSLAVD
ncbi:MAG: hypothetical protein FWG10_11845 [Eubacteriaceae bacterium]|nr:hypothetical protein [Eubacteriaceae bacterium]